MPVKTKPNRVCGYGVGGWANSVEPFESLFTSKKSIREGMDDIDCLLLWGGQDISPSYYGETSNFYNQADVFPSSRDEFEWKAMLYCKKHDIPMIGVCRGAQFMCAFAGGKLIQHVHAHGNDHQIECPDGKILWATSTHHQMMYPFKVQHEMLAWTHEPRNKVYQNGENQQIKEMESLNEPEIVYFPEIRALAIQGHPEYHNATPGFKDLCVSLAEKYLFS